MDQSYDKVKGDEEHILSLPGNRQLAYAHNGPSDSRTIILFFTGLMSIGNAREVPPPCRSMNAHWIAPTLPGMGNSSTRSDISEPYHKALCQDLSALLTHLYPTNDFDFLYLAGGSYGTVPAQMLYGAPYKLFPAGKKIVGCLLLAGFSPAKYDTAFTSRLTWQNWISVGPPSQIPFRPVQYLMQSMISSKLKTVSEAKVFLGGMLLKSMNEAEKDCMTTWLETRGRTEEEFLQAMAEGAIKCSKNWDGTMEVSEVLRADWGFNPLTLDEEHVKKPLLIVGSEDDKIGGSSNEWLVRNYRNATLKTHPGGHIASMWHMDEIWEEMIGLASG